MDIIRNVGYYLLDTTYILLNVYIYIIIANIILSWVMPPTHRVKQFLNFLTEPVVAPIRKMLEPLTRNSSIPLDFSPLVAVLIINILLEVISQIA